jgi:tRNA 5-methylaminomethyl-2-thiouridine biosynthesis bifunctional protein
VLCGATSQPGDTDPSVRASDHAHNLLQLQGLSQVDLGMPPGLDGRTGWRASSRDRLPVVGPLPAAPFAARHRPLRQRLRMQAADSGLYVLTGLGSRGLSTAALAAEVLASWITGCPCPVEADLRDAVDVARLFEAQAGAEA